ncbi:MAG: Hsp20/alpha crystallin family protein [Oscillospiraceae bacterium]
MKETMPIDFLPFAKKPEDLTSYFSEVEQAFFGAFLPGLASMRTDVLDMGDSFLLKAQLPGFSREEVSLQTQATRLVIRAAKTQAPVEPVGEGAYIRRETSQQELTRSFDISNIQAQGLPQFSNGLLEVSLRPRISSCQGRSPLSPNRSGNQRKAIGCRKP